MRVSRYSSANVFAHPEAGWKKSVVEIVERGTSRVFLRPYRGWTDFAIPPTVPPYGSTVGYYPTPLRG